MGVEEVGGKGEGIFVLLGFWIDAPKDTSQRFGQRLEKNPGSTRVLLPFIASYYVN